MQPYFALTYARAIERVLGTLLGGLVAALVGLVCTTPLAIAVAMFPLAIAAFAVRGVSLQVARGEIVDEHALLQCLQERRIAGAGLDVFENEPKVHPGLLKLTNVVLTPHIASASIDTRREMSMLAARNAVAALEGRRPPTLLNPQLWDSLSSSKGA